jgi:lipopolysaccharide export system protein LptC
VTEAKPPRFDSYTPRRISTLGRGYSLLVSVLKIGLPIVALVLIGLLIIRLTAEPLQQQKEQLAAIPKEEKTTPGQIELIKAKYEGVDEQGRPYTVTADRAVRAPDGGETVLFENPVADITLQDKTWVAARAKGGSFDHAAEKLLLKGDVSVFHDSGYEMHAEDLQISLKQKTAVTTLPVTAQGPMGTITAQNMSVEDQGDLIIFGGPATLTIFKLSAGKERG